VLDHRGVNFIRHLTSPCLVDGVSAARLQVVILGFGQTELLGQGGKFFVVGILVVIRAPGLINENGRIIVREKRAFGVIQGNPLAILTAARKFAVFHLHVGRLVGRFRTHQAHGRVLLFQALGFFQWHDFAVGRLELKGSLRAITAPRFALEDGCGRATCFGDGSVVDRVGLPGEPQCKESGKARCDQRAREMSVHVFSPF